MLSAASLPNATPPNASNAVPFTLGSRSTSTPSTIGASAPKTFASVVLTAQAAHSFAKTAGTKPKQHANTVAARQIQDSTQQSVNPLVQSQPSYESAPVFIPEPSRTDLSSQAALVVTPLQSLSNAPSVGIAASPIEQAFFAPFVQVAEGQNPQITASQSGGIVAGPETSAVAPQPDSNTNSAVSADSAPGNRTSIDPTALPDLIAVDVASSPDVPRTPEAPINSPIVTLANSHAAGPSLAERLPKVSAVDVQIPSKSSTTLVTHDIAGGDRSATSPNDSSAAAVLNPSIPSASDSTGVASQDARRSSAQHRDKIVQQITAGLQDALSQSSHIHASASSANSNSNARDPSSQGESNSQPSNSENSSSGAPDVSVVSAPASSPSGSSNDVPQKNSSLGSAAVANAAGLAAAAVQQALHAPVDASTQPAGAPAAAGTSNSNNATSTPNVQHQPNLQPLPASLGDVSRASELYQRMGNSEMRVAVETDLLGRIDLHATMHQSTLTATIGVQRSDVQTLLANDLPALQHTLADQHFHIENISVHDNSVGQRMGSSGQQESHRQNSPPHTAPAARAIPGVEFSPARELDPAMTPPSRLDRYATRLSIHV